MFNHNNTSTNVRFHWILFAQRPFILFLELPFKENVQSGKCPHIELSLVFVLNFPIVLCT